jgi:WS/DGAT/MGAT family acyltransferase
MDRLSGLDASFLYFETPAHLMHVCGLLVLDSSTIPDGYSFASMRDSLRRRLETNPAFRRKLHNPLFNIDHPVWVDDEDFDIEHHVRRAAVVAPGGPKELAELCGDIAGQPLDRSRPLWEMWIIEGIDPTAVGGGVAVMTKMHHATVDGVGGASLVSELCSIEPGSGPMGGVGAPEPTTPRPSDREIVLDGVLGIAKRPSSLRFCPAPLARSRAGCSGHAVGRPCPRRSPRRAPR